MFDIIYDLDIRSNDNNKSEYAFTKRKEDQFLQKGSVNYVIDEYGLKRPRPPAGYIEFKPRSKIYPNGLLGSPICPNCKKPAGFVYPSGIGRFADKGAQVFWEKLWEQVKAGTIDHIDALHQTFDGDELARHWSRYNHGECLKCHAKVWNDMVSKNQDGERIEEKHYYLPKQFDNNTESSAEFDETYDELRLPSDGSWQEYEWLITQMFLDDDCSIHTNQKITGKLSGKPRQVDIVARAENGDITIIDCKKRKSPINIKVVEEFIGMMHDTGAQKGILISSKGFTEGAKNRSTSQTNLILKHVDWQKAYGNIATGIVPNRVAEVCGNCRDWDERLFLNRIIWYEARVKQQPGTEEWSEELISIFIPGVCIRCECVQLYCDPCGVSSCMEGDELKCPDCKQSYGTFSELYGYKKRPRERPAS